MTDLTNSESSSETTDGSRQRELAERGTQELNPDALYMDGLDSAIIGLGNQYSKPPVVIYDENKILDALMDQGMDIDAVSYTNLRAHETRNELVCRHLLEKKKRGGGG